MEHVRRSKYKIIFATGYTPNWSKEVFLIKIVKNAVPWLKMLCHGHMLLVIFNVQEIVGTFYERKLQKISQN